MAELTLQQLQSQIDELYQLIEDFRANNESDHSSISEQILDQTESSLNISSRLNTLDNTVKETNSDIASISSRLQNIDKNTDDILSLQQELNDIKLTLNDGNLPEIQSRLSLLNSKIEAVKSNWVTKTSFESFASEINDKLNKKALDSDLRVINDKVTTLENRAAVDVVSEVESIKKNLENINNSIGKIENDVIYNSNSISTNRTYLDELIISIQDSILDINNRCESIENGNRDNDRKIVETNRRISNTNCDINELRLKFNKLVNQLTEVQVIINNNISNIEQKHNRDIQDVIVSTDRKIQSSIRDHNTYMAGHTREFAELRNRLNNIDGTNGELSTIRELANKKWITVLTPEEYKKLPAVSKKQDQLYMCIKYGKPYALYIGSVLIAQRNSTKENGFVYSFPLSF